MRFLKRKICKSIFEKFAAEVFGFKNERKRSKDGQTLAKVDMKVLKK